MVAPSKRNCRIAQRIARVPRRARGVHTEWFCSIKVAIWQVVSRHIQRRLCHRIRAGPRPRARRSSPRPRDCGLERFSPQPGQPAKRSQDSMSSTRASGVRATLIALQTDEQITPITTIKRHGAAAGRVRHRPRSLKTAGVEVRSSSRTSTPTPNPRSTPGHPHSTRKSHKSDGIHLGVMLVCANGTLIGEVKGSA